MSEIIAIGGGKGGIGKTVIAASLGVGLASLDKEVVIVDADFAGADLHLALGLETPGKTFFDFYKGEARHLDEILIEHPYFEKLKIMSGVNGALGLANFKHSQKMKFFRHLMRLDCDYVILDLGAGNSYNILDSFLLADHGIVVLKPDPLSIHEGYHFIKLVILRHIVKLIKTREGGSKIIQELSKPETRKSTPSLDKLIAKISRFDKTVASEIRRFLRSFHPQLLINELTNTDDEVNCLKVKDAAQKILGIHMEYIGAIRWDASVRKSLIEMTPFMLYDAKSPAAKDLTRIINLKLLGNGLYKQLTTKRTLKNKMRQGFSFKKDEVICSVHCVYWGVCNYQRGGLPCRLHPFIKTN
jgi:flagellar biosynthesis protein FlhG